MVPNLTAARSYLEPHAEICCNEVHKAQPGGKLSSVDVHLLVQEDEVHLEEDEHQLKTGAQEPEKVPQLFVLFVLWLLWHHLDMVIACLLSSNISPSSIPV